MDYMSLNEAAHKWKVSSSEIEKLCFMGLIPNAVKIGRTWMIPANTKWPVKYKVENNKDILSDKILLSPRECPLSLMTDLYNTPGSGDDLVGKYKEQPQIALFLKAQLDYFRGDYDLAYTQTRSFMSYPVCFDIQVGVGILLSLCASIRGDLLLWEEAKQYVASISCQNRDERHRLAFWLAAIDSIIDDGTTFPKWFQHGSFDLLPRDAFPFVYFFYVKYLLLGAQEALSSSKSKNHQYNLLMTMISAACEPLISQVKIVKAILPEIYLRLLCAITYYNTGDEDMAIIHLDRAIELALPDQLFSPFAEIRQSFGYLLDDRLAKFDEKALQKVKTLNKKVFDGWLLLHNMKLGRTKSSELTIREREVAKLAVYGYTNAEIAERLHVSLNTVKQALWHAMNKTDCKKRQELVKYLRSF